MNLQSVVYLIAILLIIGVVWALVKIWLPATFPPQITQTIILIAGLAILLWLIFALTGWTLPGFRAP